MSKTYIGAYNLVNPNLAYNDGNSTVNNPLTSNLDAGGNKILNLQNPADSGDAVNLGYLQSVIPSTGDFITNPLTSTLNCNNFEVTNCIGVLMKDSVNPLNSYWINTENGGLVTTSTTDATDIKLFININETEGKDFYTDFRGHPITNVGSLGILNGGNITGQNNTINLTTPLDMNNNYIKDVQNIQFFNAPPIEVDLSNNLLYNDSIIVTASNIGEYISQANWEPNASSDLNMNDHNINLATGNINLKAGEIIFNNSFTLQTDTNNDLTFDNNKVLVCEPKILESLPFVDSTPGSAISIFELNPIVLLSNSISKAGVLNNPIFDISIDMTMQTVFTVDLTSCQFEVGLCNLQNPLNSSNIQSLFTFTGGFKQNGGVLSARFRTDESVNILHSWSDAVTAVGASNFYIYILATAVSVDNPTVNIINIQSSSVKFNVIDTGDQFTKNELITINENSSLQLYTTTPPIELQSNGFVEIPIVDYSQNTALLSAGSFYVKCTVVATNLCLKFSTFIFDNAIVESSGSQSIIYQDNSFVSCGLYLTNNVLSAKISMNSNLVALSMCKCKTKIIAPI